MERKTGFEPATLSLARRCSTTEPLPPGAERQNRTADTAIFSRVLYQLSYLGPPRGPCPGLARFAHSTRSILCAFWACQAPLTPPVGLMREGGGGKRGSPCERIGVS